MREGLQRTRTIVLVFIAVLVLAIRWLFFSDLPVFIVILLFLGAAVAGFLVPKLSGVISRRRSGR